MRMCEHFQTLQFWAGCPLDEFHGLSGKTQWILSNQSLSFIYTTPGKKKGIQKPYEEGKLRPVDLSWKLSRVHPVIHCLEASSIPKFCNVLEIEKLEFWVRSTHRKLNKPSLFNSLCNKGTYCLKSKISLYYAYHLKDVVIENNLMTSCMIKGEFLRLFLM